MTACEIAGITGVWCIVVFAFHCGESFSLLALWIYCCILSAVWWQEKNPLMFMISEPKLRVCVCLALSLRTIWFWPWLFFCHREFEGRMVYLIKRQEFTGFTEFALFSLAELEMRELDEQLCSLVLIFNCLQLSPQIPPVQVKNGTVTCSHLCYRDQWKR